MYKKIKHVWFKTNVLLCLWRTILIILNAERTRKCIFSVYCILYNEFKLGAFVMKSLLVILNDLLLHPCLVIITILNIFLEAVHLVYDSGFCFNFIFFH